MWFIFTLLSALFASLRRGQEKQLSQSLDHFTIGWAVQLFSLPIIVIMLLGVGQLLNPFSLGWQFWLPTCLVWFGFYPLNTFLYISAIKHGELSKLAPLQSLGPILALLLAWLFVGQQPSWNAGLGIIITVCGIYALNLTGRKLHNPLRMFTHDKASTYTLGALVLVAIVGVLDVIAIRASDPLYYTFVTTVGAVFVLFSASKVCKTTEKASLRSHLGKLTATGTLSGATYGLYTIALTSGPLAYVSSIRGGFILLMTTCLGIFHLKEKMTPQKAAAIFLVLLGSAVIVLG